MRLDVYFHNDVTDDIILRLERIEQMLKQQGEQMALDFTKLEAALKKESDAELAVENLLKSLIQAIKDISAGSNDPATQAKLDQLAADTDARTDVLVAATLEGTGAIPPTP